MIAFLFVIIGIGLLLFLILVFFIEGHRYLHQYFWGFFESLVGLVGFKVLFTGIESIIWPSSTLNKIIEYNNI